MQTAVNGGSKLLMFVVPAANDPAACRCHTSNVEEGRLPAQDEITQARALKIAVMPTRPWDELSGSG